MLTTDIKDFKKLFKRLNLSLDRKIRKLKHTTKQLQDPKNSDDTLSSTRSTDLN